MISPRSRSSKSSKSVASVASTSRNSLSKQEPSIRRLPLDDVAEHENPANKATVKRSNPRSSSTTKPRISVSCRNLDQSKEPRKIRSVAPGVTKPRTSSVQRSRSSDDGERVHAPSIQRHRSSVDGSILQRRAMSVQKRRPDAHETQKSEHRSSKESTHTVKRSSSTVRTRSDASTSKPLRSEHSKSHTKSTEKEKSLSRSSCPESPGKSTRRKISKEDARSVQSIQDKEETPEKPPRRKVGDARSVQSNHGGEETPEKATRRKVAGDVGRSVHSSRAGDVSPGKHTRRKVTEDGRSVQSSKVVEESPGKHLRRKMSGEESRSVHSKGNASSEGHPLRSKRSESIRQAKEHSEPRSPTATKRRTVAVTDAPHSPGKRRITTRNSEEDRKSRSSHKTSSGSPKEHINREKSTRKRSSPPNSSSVKTKSTNDSGGKTLRRPSLLDTSEMQNVEVDKIHQKSSEDASDSDGGGSANSRNSHCSHTSSASTVIQFDPTQKNGVAHVEQKESFVDDDDDCLSIASFHDPIGDAHRIMNTNPQHAPILSFLESDGEEMDELQSCFSPTALRCPSGGESVQGGVRCPSGGESVQTSDSNTSSTLGKLQFYVPSTSGTIGAPPHPLIFDIEEFQDFVASSEEKSVVDLSKAPKSSGTKKKAKESKDVGAATVGKLSPENRKSESLKKKSKEDEADDGNTKRQLKSRSSRRALKKTASSEQLFEAAVMKLKNESNGLQPPSDDDDSDSEDERLRNNFSRTVGLAVGMTAYESELEASPSKKQPKTGLGIGKYFFGNSNRKKRDNNGDEDASDSDYSCSSTSSRRSVFGGRMGRRHSLLGNGDFENAVVPFSS
jgi:hypothetical protein